MDRPLIEISHLSKSYRRGDQVIDLSRPIDADCELAPIAPASPEGLDVIRHSTAHLLAQAVKQIETGV